jgi:hypothetical protein
VLKLADPAHTKPPQHQVGRDQRDSAARHAGARLFADQAMPQQQLHLAVAVGHAAGGNVGASDRLVEDDDGQHQSDGLGQLQGLEHLAALEVREQALNEAARRPSGDQLEPIVAEQDLLAARRFGP